MHLSGSARGVVVYQYTRKKFAKIPQNTQNSSKYSQNYTQVYFIPEIQRKWYTEYPYLSCNIPYTRFKSPCIPYTQKPWPTLIYQLGVCPEDMYELCFPLSPKFWKFRVEMKWKGPFRFDSTRLFGITFEGSLILVGKRPMSISLPLDLYYESNTYPWGPHKPCIVISNQPNRYSQHFIAALGISRQ